MAVAVLLDRVAVAEAEAEMVARVKVAVILNNVTSSQSRSWIIITREWIATWIRITLQLSSDARKKVCEANLRGGTR